MGEVSPPGLILTISIGNCPSFSSPFSTRPLTFPPLFPTMEVFFGTSGHSVARQVRQSLYALSFCLPEPQAHLPSATSSSAALGSGPFPAALSSPLERAAFSIPPQPDMHLLAGETCPAAEQSIGWFWGPQKRVFRWSRAFAAESYHRHTGIAGGKTFPPFLYDLKFLTGIDCKFL